MNNRKQNLQNIINKQNHIKNEQCEVKSKQKLMFKHISGQQKLQLNRDDLNNKSLFNINQYSSNDKLILDNQSIKVEKQQKKTIINHSIFQEHYGDKSNIVQLEQNMDKTYDKIYQKNESVVQECDIPNTMYRVNYLKYEPTQKATNMPNLPSLFCFKKPEGVQLSDYQSNYSHQQSPHVPKVYVSKQYRKPISHNFGSNYQLNYINFDKESIQLLNKKQNQEHHSSFNFQDNKNFHIKDYFKNTMQSEAKKNYQNFSLQLKINDDDDY